MNWLKRKVLDRFYSPELSRAVEASGGLLRAAKELDLMQGIRQEFVAARDDLERLGRESSFMKSGPQSVRLTERFWELELALEDRGWKRQFALSALEFSRYGIQQLILICRLYFIKNPLIKRTVMLSNFYVFGRGVEISCEDTTANKVLQDFLELNRAELGHLGLMEKNQTLKTDGNLFFVFFINPRTGACQVRTIDATEMEEVISDPNDASKPWYFHRRWNEETFDMDTGTRSDTPREAWYPALNYMPAARPPRIMGKEVKWGSPVYHRKTGGLPKWKFGCPEVYAAIDWARAYKGFLEDWSTITKALARFAYNVETQGGQQAINLFSQVLTSTLGNGGTQIEQQPPPVVGASFVTGPGNKITPMKTAGATTEPEQGRRVLLMVAAAEGWAETMFGDASTGSLATALSLDRPTELMIVHRQELFREMIIEICTFALACSAGAAGGVMKEAKKKSADIAVKVDFPAVLEHDILARIQAITAATTLENHAGQIVGIDIKVACRLMLQELGVEDVETVLESMFPDKEYDPDRTKVDLTAPLPNKLQPNPGGDPQAGGGTVPAPGQNAPAPTAPAKEAILLLAIAELQKASEKLRKNREQVEDPTLS